MSDDLDLFLSFSIDVKMIRLLNNILVPTELHLSASIERSEEASDYDMELGIAKCRYWLEHVVTKTIAFNKDNDLAVEMFIDPEARTPRVANIFMLTPGEPRDELLGMIFQAKLTALSGGAFTVEAMNVESDNLNGLCFTLGGNHAAVFLPTTMEAWLGAESYFDVPWWMRDDRSTLDVYLTEDADVTTPPAWASSLNFLDKRTKKVEDNMTVIRPEFKPTIIKGGKDEGDD